ncbi:MAG: ATP-binding protein [Rhodanobacter sp.]|nr:MAG: ATP-binding protein [Rhodanobacter sp.]
MARIVGVEWRHQPAPPTPATIGISGVQDAHVTDGSSTQDPRVEQARQGPQGSSQNLARSQRHRSTRHPRTPVRLSWKDAATVIAKPIGSITEADLLQLIQAGTPESKHIKYKRTLPDGGDSGKVKFLRSVTALANTQGGDLIYGMEASDGIPQQLCALTMPSADQVLQRLESLCADGVSPRLAGVQYRFVPLSGGGEVLVIRIQKSWNAPHRVTAGGHAHFYGRNAAGSYPLDVGELRQAFTLSESVAERIRAFRAKRLLALGNGEVPIPLVPGVRVVLHIVPLQSLTSEFLVDISPRTQQQMQALNRVEPPGAGGWSQRVNLDGRVKYDNECDGMARAYAQLYRSGMIEAVQVWPE